MLDDINDKLGAGTDLLDGISGANARKPAPLPVVKSEFENGEDLDAPPDGAVPLPVPPNGQSPAPNSKKMEFLHFGTTYKATSRRYFHQELDDLDPDLDLSMILGGRGIMFQAALQREILLLGGFIDACREGFKEDDAQKGALGDLMGRVGDLLGGGGSSSETKPEDLNQFFTRLQAVAPKITKPKVAYKDLHEAAIELHDIRASYRQFLTDQVEAGRKAPSTDAGGPLGGGILGGLPGLGSLLPPELGVYFKLIKDMAFRAHAVHLLLAQEVAVRMEPAIEQACRDMTIGQIRNRITPIFPCWFKAPEVDNVIDAPDGPDSTGLDPIDGAVGSVMGAITDATNAVNKVANPIRDFLTYPESNAPGRPYLDQAFQFTGAPDASGAGGDTTLDADPLGKIASDALAVALGVDLPEIVRTIVGGISQVLSGFVRAAYSRLLSLDPTVPLNEDDFLAAGRSNLIASLIDVALRAFDVLDTLRDLKLDMTGIPGIERVISAEAIVNNAILMLSEKIADPMAPVTDDAMKEFFATLEGARQAHTKSMTMEAYLAVLPISYARLFRRVFFPMWNLLVDAVVGPAGDAIGGAMNKIDQEVMGLRNDITDVRNDLDKASKVIDYYSKNGLKVGSDDNTGMLGQILGQPDAFGQAAPPGTPPLIAKPALAARPNKASADALTDELLAEVEPNHKWVPEPADDAADDDATNGQTADAS